MDLAGCEKVTDLTLRRLVHALHSGKFVDKNMAVANPKGNVSDSFEQSCVSEKTKKTLKNEKFSRTKKVCDTDLRKTGLNAECKIVKTKSSDSLLEADSSVPACSRLVERMEYLGLNFSEKTFCSCPLARKLFPRGQIWSASIEDCTWLPAASRPRSHPVSSSFCDIREATQLNSSDTMYDRVDFSPTSLDDPPLEHLSLSGCWLITDAGLR